MAYEAADTGLLSPELVSGIRRVKEYRKLGRRVGNWLSPQSANSSPWEPLLNTSARRPRSSLFSLIVACGDLKSSP